LKLGMMGVFNGSNLVGISSEDQSKGINFLNDMVKTTLIVTEYNGGYVVVELSQSNTEKKVEINNGKPKFIISINTTGSIEEVATDLKVDQPEVIEIIKKSSEDEIKRIINEAINYSKELKTDIFNLGSLIYKKDHKLWKEIKDNWEDEILNDVEIEVKVDLDLKTKGSIDNVIEVR